MGQTLDRPDQRRLARARLADQCQHLAGHHREVDPVDGTGGSEVNVQILHHN